MKIGLPTTADITEIETTNSRTSNLLSTIHVVQPSNIKRVIFIHELDFALHALIITVIINWNGLPQLEDCMGSRYKLYLPRCFLTVHFVRKQLSHYGKQAWQLPGTCQPLEGKKIMLIAFLVCIASIFQCYT